MIDLIDRLKARWSSHQLRPEIIRFPTDGAAKESATERREGGSLAVVFAGTVASGGGLMEIGLISHGSQLRRHLSRMGGMNAIILAACCEQDRRILLAGLGDMISRNLR